MTQDEHEELIRHCLYDLGMTHAEIAPLTAEAGGMPADRLGLALHAAFLRRHFPVLPIAAMIEAARRGGRSGEGGG